VEEKILNHIVHLSNGNVITTIRGRNSKLDKTRFAYCASCQFAHKQSHTQDAQTPCWTKTTWTYTQNHHARANTKTGFATHASDNMDLLEELLRSRDQYERTGIESHSLNESIDRIITEGMQKRK